VTTGNTMAPCVVIGERAAAMLQDEHSITTSFSGSATGASANPVELLADARRTPPP